MASVLSWLAAHQTVEVAFGVALLDFVFALAPKAESNGVLHWIYLQLTQLKK